MRKLLEYKVGDLNFKTHCVREELMINELKALILKAANGNKQVKEKIVDIILKAICGINDLSRLSIELQEAIKVAADWLLIEGINIYPVLNIKK
jgi:hypothetical protein